MERNKGNSNEEEKNLLASDFRQQLLEVTSEIKYLVKSRNVSKYESESLKFEEQKIAFHLSNQKQWLQMLLFNN